MGWVLLAFKRKMWEEGVIEVGSQKAWAGIYLSTAVKEKWIRVRIALSAVWETVSNVLLVLKAVVNDAIGQEEEIGSKGKCPGASDCW